MKAAIIVFPGSNCDRDMQVAIRAASGQEPIMVWHKDTELPQLDLIAVPGGFSYGDYLRSGAIAAHSPIMKEVAERAAMGVPVLGICNGFQILTETGLLPGALMRNAGLKYICRDVWLKVEQTHSIFTRGYDKGQIIRVPIAHHDGNYFCDDVTVNRLEDQNRIAFRYCESDGSVSDDANPNGSRHNIAGILNRRKNILGMMPHPERLISSTLGGSDGKAMFDSAVTALTS
ncbi:MAG: phosphoribosylformylglycinamidine synthase I [Rhodospirillaceae bacterium TMED8]|nr:phosphoribosylformylglycinamidine synthase I [Magnetovibrio sp.]OUT49847.1 MAG: phosphoribosylformylglycinamidine synthase I [Rhodospirillaceae bacterium TMED8]|tara:strand:+ start:6251 stop:6943 length:693 start_codon:yes stop_codon:yes gene_type:complete